VAGAVTYRHRASATIPRGALLLFFDVNQATAPVSAYVLDKTQALSILRGCLAATRGESRTTEKAMTLGSMKKTCRYSLN
jgi:hypothetical protein